ncbi:hypothetical protein CXB51_009674 [Gossypium anomalum]|uniref:Uncharacterized protein n=1 Tax=Gossypium anomalum TaxID=47600 RepID=A0A8J5Z1P3_9ROSI|nr:hypothetical protein CXB51_009674 [Gossypium anomalum]
MNICLTFTPFETTTRGLPILTLNSPPQASTVTKELGTPTGSYEAPSSRVFHCRSSRTNGDAREELVAHVWCWRPTAS